MKRLLKAFKRNQKAIDNYVNKVNDICQDVDRVTEKFMKKL
ncbi:hypothetical protein 000TH008_29 [Bacillus phage 000TH008]|nr:hypothetical protein 000TH008_29 [Bacillus phage 000TH008]QQO40723.1 hypothetical protein 000TH009_29 [Bacillus phage 000TH009]